MQAFKKKWFGPFVHGVKQPLLLKISFRAFNYFAELQLMAGIASEGDVRKHCSVKNYNHLNEDDYFQRSVFLNLKTSSFASSMCLNAVQMITKYGVFFFETIFLFIYFGSSFPTSLVSFALQNDIFQLIIHRVISCFYFFGLYLKTVHS